MDRVGDIVYYQTRLGFCPALLLTLPRGDAKSSDLRLFLPDPPHADQPQNPDGSYRFTTLETAQGTAFRPNVILGDRPGTWRPRDHEE